MEGRHYPLRSWGPKETPDRKLDDPESSSHEMGRDSVSREFRQRLEQGHVVSRRFVFEDIVGFYLRRRSPGPMAISYRLNLN